MGIGRASGENRAVQAAQQAVESPLLEVSIDGARGILFNVIGGLDMSMHEINTAAETITAAADPDANIIFGATINPDLEGEIIITVVATGFDAAYFANRVVSARPADGFSSPEEQPKTDEKVMQDIDMDLGDDAKTEEFHQSTPMPNIWTLDHEEDAKEKDSEEKNSSKPAVFTEEPNEDEDELEKPSFLRRLKKRHQKTDESSEDKDKKDRK